MTARVGVVGAKPARSARADGRFPPAEVVGPAGTSSSGFWLAAGVLPLATAYSISEALGFEKGVSSNFREAPIFLGIFTFLIALGALIAMMPGLPLIRVLIITQVINGVLLPVILVAVLRLVNNDADVGGSATISDLRVESRGTGVAPTSVAPPVRSATSFLRGADRCSMHPDS